MKTKKRKNHKLWTVSFEDGTIRKEGYKYYPCKGKKCFNCWAEKAAEDIEKNIKRGTGI